MHIELSEKADEFIRRSIETGRHRRAEEAVRETLDLWIERERRREELLALLDEGEASLAGGEGIVITKEAMRQLAKDVHERGTARLAERRSKQNGAASCWTRSATPGSVMWNGAQAIATNNRKAASKLSIST